MAKLYECCTKASSNIKQSDLKQCNGKYPIYGASGFIKNVDFYIQPKPYIAVVKDGAGVGRVMKLPAFSSVIGTLQYIIPNDNIDIDYLTYAMEAMNLAKYHSGATIPHIYFKDYCNEELRLYDKEIQNEIVDIISKVNNLLLKRNNQLSKLEELVKSRFVEMFGEDTNTDKTTINEVCSIITDGTHQPPKFQKEGIPFIFVSNIAQNEITYNAEKFISKQTYNELVKRTPIEIGDILLSTVGSYGHPAIVKENRKFLFQRHIAYLKPKQEKINSVYLYGAILSHNVQKQIDEKVKGIAQKTLNLSEIRKIVIPLPKMNKQTQFADFVKQVDKSKFEIEQSLEKLELLKKALMQKYFG